MRLALRAVRPRAAVSVRGTEQVAGRAWDVALLEAQSHSCVITAQKTVTDGIG